MMGILLLSRTTEHLVVRDQDKSRKIGTLYLEETVFSSASC